MEQSRMDAKLTGVDAAQVLAHVEAELAAHDLPVEARGTNELHCDIGIGRIRLLSAGSEVRVELDAGSQSELFMLRESVHARLDSLSPGLSDQLRWSGAPVTGPHPPNFRKATVVGKRRIAPRFMRLRLAAPDLTAFARSGLHFRLLIPPNSRDPVWPTLDERGRTRWPEGEERLHCPAYTIRSIDAAAGLLDVDVFLHGQGPTCAWAQKVEPDAPVGIAGPGGGWYPKARHLVLAGDETALPAIARILENAPDETLGLVLVYVRAHTEVMELRHPPGIALRWLIRGEKDADLNSALEALPLPPGPDRFVWFAAESGQARRAKRYLREHAGLSRSETQIAAYWVDS